MPTYNIKAFLRETNPASTILQYGPAVDYSTRATALISAKILRDMDSVGIKYSLSCETVKDSVKIKDNPEDFVVQEVIDGRRCEPGPVVDVSRFREAEELLTGPPAPGLSKEERTKLYEIAKFHPFKRMFTKDGTLHVETNSTDLFVFTLLKCEYSDFSIQKLLASRLDVPLEHIQAGGTKDKHGITLQEMSAKCTFEKLFNYALSLAKASGSLYEDLGFCKEFSAINTDAEALFGRYMTVEEVPADSGVGIYNIRRGNSKKLGDLSGNYFKIKVRGENLGGKATAGKFYNYFGAQRFGNCVNNHIIGELILGGKHAEALELMLEDSKAPAAKQNSVQRQILRMQAEGIPAKLIVQRLPRKTQMIYLHAYQSYLFNRDLNDRVERGTPKVGEDKVLVEGEYKDVDGSERLEDIYIPLRRMSHKLLKGGVRKMIEDITDLERTAEDDGVTFKFYLLKSSYATVALRDLLGREVIGRSSE